LYLKLLFYFFVINLSLLFYYFYPIMRAVVFYVYLSLLLFCGGYALYATTHYSHTGYSAARNAVKRQHSKVTPGSQTNTSIDDADIDLDEDYLGGHDTDEGSTIKTVTDRYALTSRWYLSFANAVILNYTPKPDLISPPICGDPSPLYITQRVLRI
jgi:hypothetical protein